jgi:hypothetical protein
VPNTDEPDTVPDDRPPLLEEDPLGNGLEEEAGEGAKDGEFDELLPDLPSDPDLDDANASELESGVELDEDEDDESNAEESHLDVGNILDDDDAIAAGSVDGDEAGPSDDVLGNDIGSFASDDGDESVDPRESLDDLIDEASLPRIETDESEESGLGDALFETVIISDEEPPRRADLMWGEMPLAHAEAPRTVVRKTTSGAAACGGDVVVIDDGGARRVLARHVPGGVRSAVVDEAAETLLYATNSGALFRVALSAESPEALVAYHDALGSLAVEPELSLGGPTPSARPAVLLHVGGAARTLLESTDHGTTWRRVELRGSVLALSTGSPPSCLVATERGARLYRSGSSGGFSAVGPVWPPDTEVPELASSGDVLVAHEVGSFLRVSADGGVTFRPVPGTSNATAITAGRLGQRPWAFAALFDPASGRAAIVSIDAASAEAAVIAHLEPDGDEEMEDAYRAVSLSWDESTETLYVAGEFGLTRFRRPPSA